MTDPNESPLRLLREATPPALDAQGEAARRARITGRIHALQAELQTELTARPQRVSPLRHLLPKSTTARWTWLAAALTMSLGVGVFLIQQSNSEPAARLRVASGEVTLTSARGQTELRADQDVPLDEDVTVATHAASASWQLPSEATVAMDGATALKVSRTDRAHARGDGKWGEQLSLTRGKVALRVPHLAAAQFLAVQTADAWVEVHGTEFTVTVVQDAAGNPATTVTVKEGVVSVTAKGERTLLSAGQSWTSAPAVAVSTHPPQGAVPDPVAPSSAAPASTLSTSPTHAASSAPANSAASHASDLAAQNRLFLSAQDARKTGQTNVALQRFQAVMTQYPGSELAHNARVEHFRLLRAAGRTGEARRSAQAYLDVYPRGFARAEARALLAP